MNTLGAGVGRNVTNARATDEVGYARGVTDESSGSSASREPLSLRIEIKLKESEHLLGQGASRHERLQRLQFLGQQHPEVLEMIDLIQSLNLR